MSTKQLKATADRLAREWRDMSDDLAAKKGRLLATAKEIIEAELAPEAEKIEAKKVKAREAIIAYQDAHIQDVIAEGKPWPEGTLVIRPVNHGGGTTATWMRGKVEVWRRGSKVMKSRAKAPPEPGDVVIRTVHRDGSEGVTYEQVYPWSVGSWAAKDGTPPKLVERPPLKV